MTGEQKILAKLQRLSERDREQLLRQIDQWIEHLTASEPVDEKQAMAVVETTWASISLDEETLRWIAEDKELEYDVD